MAVKTCSERTYASLKHCTGSPVQSGMRNRLYYIRRADVVSIPSLPALDGATPETAAVITDNFVLAEAKKWLYIDLVFDKGTVESTAEGEYPNAMFVNKVNVTHPHRDAAATGFARMALNDDFLYLFQERDGRFRLIGSEAYHATTKPSQKTGAKPTDESGTYLEISAYDECPAPFYQGKIETEDGDIDGKTGGPASPELP